MESLLDCRKHCEHLDKSISEAQTRWHTFLSAQRGYRSNMKLYGQYLPAPVMTAEKKKKMQMYRKQAYIVEVRKKSRSREKDFMNKIQGALDEIREFHVNTSSSEEELSERTQLRLNLSACTDSSSQPGNDSSSLLNTAVFVPSLAHDSPAITVESQHIPDQPVSSPRKQIKAKSTTDLTRTGQDTKSEIAPVIKGAKIHRRRRCNSEGKSDSESTQLQSASANRPRQSSKSPSRSKRSQSSNNLLTIPFENYLIETDRETLQEDGTVISRPRQRYREEKARCVRTPSPQPLVKLETSKQAARPVSTPPVIMKSYQRPESPARKQLNTIASVVSVVSHTPKTISSKALKCLLENLDPSHDKPTHQWLAERVAGHVQTTQDDISLEDWFQNAPDSVKQKLVLLLPKLSNEVPVETKSKQSTGNKSVDVQISVVQLCNSADDTLRSTSPIPDEARGDNPPSLCLSQQRESDEVEEVEEDYQLVVIDRSPRSETFPPAESSLVAESQPEHDDTPFMNEPASTNQLKHGMGHKYEQNQPGEQTIGSSERRRTLSMQSYTLDEPSEALINSTLNENTPDRASAARDDTHQTTDANSPDRKSRKDSQKRSKSRIPTPQVAKTLLSKCQLDTPSPGTAPKIIHNTTETPSSKAATLRLRQLSKLINSSDVAKDRALTNTPPRVMTPTPPDRPRSEIGTDWSRSRSRNRFRERQTEDGDSMLKPTNTMESANSNADSGTGRKKSAIPRSKSCRQTTPKQPSVESRKVKRSVSFDRMEPSHAQKPGDGQFESPLKSDEPKSQRLMRARQQLALLKSKFAAKIKSIQESPRPASATTFKESADKQVNVAERPNTVAAIAIDRPSVDWEKTKPSVSSKRLQSDDGKENLDVVRSPSSSRPQSRCLSRSEYEEIPIGTVYTSSVEQATDISSGKVLSVSHLTNKLQCTSTSTVSKSAELCKASLMFDKVNSERLAAFIKGHLCRRLFKCSKVKSIIKTIQDCKNLLPNITAYSGSTALHDVNFQQRLKLQMLAARNDLHNVFFEMPSYQRIALIKQSEKVQARLRMRQSNRSKQDERPNRSSYRKESGRRLRAKAFNADSSVKLNKPAILSSHSSANTHMKPMLV